MFIKHRAHCGRLWVVEVEGKVQVTLEAKLINILIWKLCFFQLVFILFLAGVKKSSAFCTLWLLYPKVELWIIFFVSNRTLDISTFGYSSHSVQKALDFSTPAKNRIKMSWKKHNFQIKILISLASRVTWTLPSTSTTHRLPQCALCSINISKEMLNILSFNHPTSLFSYLSYDFWGFTEQGQV